MPKIKKILIVVKNDIKEYPTHYIYAAIGGIVGGAIAYALIKKDETDTSMTRLYFNRTAAEHMKETGTPMIFETSIGDFKLEYVTN